MDFIELKDKISHDLFPKLYEVYNIFEEFYGEPYVDLHIELVESFQADLLAKVKEDYDVEDIYSLTEEQYKVVIDKHKYFIQRCVRISCILIHFPDVTVTNENNNSINIKDLFIKVKVSVTGSLIGTFAIIRTSYSTKQFINDYMHSHIDGIFDKYGEAAREDRFAEDISFLYPCLGSGPIKNTCTTLNVEFNDDIWKLFCYELSLYVKNESLEGIPYRRLENVCSVNKRELEYRSIINSIVHISPDSMQLLGENFVLELMKLIIFNPNFRLVLQGNYWVLGIPMDKAVILFSDIFIKFFNAEYGNTAKPNKDIILRNFCKKNVTYTNNKFYTEGSDEVDNEKIGLCQGMPLFYFKGKLQYLTIEIDSPTDTDLRFTVLKPVVFHNLLYQIIKLFNYYYTYDTTTIGYPDKKSHLHII